MTASHFEVKTQSKKPVLVRHWICNKCLYNKITKNKMSLYEKYYVNDAPYIEQLYNLNDEEYRQLSFEQKMELVEKAFKNDEIDRAEQIDIEDDLIMEQAFIEAAMWEF